MIQMPREPEQLAWWFLAETPKPSAPAKVAAVVEPKAVPPIPPRTWGDCQAAEAKRVRLVMARTEVVKPEPCAAIACRHNLRRDFPRAPGLDGEICVLRIAEMAPSMEQIAAAIGVTKQAVQKIEARGLARCGASAAAETARRTLDDPMGGEVHSPERRLRRALVKCGPMTWPEIRDELGLPPYSRHGGESYRVREALMGMVRRREVAAVERDGEAMFSVEDDE